MNPGISGAPARAGGHERRAGALLEREREIARATALIDLAGSGEAGVLMFEGPTGIGKTRLLAEAAAAAEGAGLRTLSARASELERDYPSGWCASGSSRWCSTRCRIGARG